MRSAKDRSKKPAAPKPFPSTVCYCDGEREVGTLELFCSGCLKWFHGRCLKELQGLMGALPFMVCYVFHCNECSPSKTETWMAKNANFIHMLITVLANLTHKQRKDGGDVKIVHDHVYFNLEGDIIPFFNENWENLTSMPRRVKNTWHQTVQKTLAKESDLFKMNPDDDNGFALAETNLATIGPIHDAVKQIGKKTSSSNNLVSTLLTAQPVEKVEDVVDAGPKTRGASKRRNVEGTGQPGKKGKYAADSVQSKVFGMANPVDFPFNKEGYRYYLVEKDPTVPDLHIFEQEVDLPGRVIPAFIYRLSLPPTVTISPNDRAYQLKVSDDMLSVTGWEGYCVARANHSVTRGTWYYEVNFLRQPEGSHIRIGWSQPLAALQACLGYTKFSYSWRSLRGTKFHDAHGKKYQSGGYKEGDVLGCLIHLPMEAPNSVTSSSYLPPPHKDLPLINFKHNYFYEGRDEVSEELKKLQPHKGSKIEFFLNGKSCGVAYDDVFGGFYHPAVSIFQGATIQCNFGPRFKYPQKGAQPMSARAEQVQHEQTMSDMLYLVENADEMQRQSMEIRSLQAAQAMMS